MPYAACPLVNALQVSLSSPFALFAAPENSLVSGALSQYEVSTPSHWMPGAT